MGGHGLVENDDASVLLSWSLVGATEKRPGAQWKAGVGPTEPAAGGSQLQPPPPAEQ